MKLSEELGNAADRAHMLEQDVVKLRERCREYAMAVRRAEADVARLKALLESGRAASGLAAQIESHTDTCRLTVCKICDGLADLEERGMNDSE